MKVQSCELRERVLVRSQIDVKGKILNAHVVGDHIILPAGTVLILSFLIFFQFKLDPLITLF